MAAQRAVGEDAMLEGKKVIALGERDGIQAGAIAACARAAGAEVVLEKTYRFV
jgi:glycine/sarcosine/betaine reductase complex component A